jgi:hypothetical protein
MAAANYHKSNSIQLNNYLGTYTFAHLHDCYAELPLNCEETRQIIDGKCRRLLPDIYERHWNGNPDHRVPTQFTLPAVTRRGSTGRVHVISRRVRANPRAQVSFGVRYRLNST